MDNVEDIDLTNRQAAFLSRAKALTLAQGVIAREIAERTLGSDATNDQVATLIQALATNYLAAVTQSNG